MKNKIFALALLYIINAQSSQELMEAPAAIETRQPIALFAAALQVTDLQHLVLDYLNSWECRETLSFPDAWGINSIVISPDSESLVSCDRSFIKIWKYVNKQWVCIQTLKRNEYSVFSAIFSTDGKYLISGGADNRVTIWHQNINKQWEFEQALDGNENLVTRTAISPDGKYLAAGNGNTIYPTLRIWKQDNNKWSFLQAERYRPGRGNSPNQIDVIIFSPDGGYLAFCGSWNNFIQIWQKDTDKWKSSQNLEEHTERIMSVAFSPNGKYLVSGSLDKTIKIWQQDDKNQWLGIQTLEGHTSGVTSVAFSSNGKYLVSGSNDKTIKIWQQDQNNKWTCIQTLEGHMQSVNSVIFSPNGEYIASGSFDNTIKIWRNQKLEILAGAKKDNHEK